MHHNYSLSRATHTVEMAQIAELNDHLAARESDDTICAGDLGLTDAIAHSFGNDNQCELPARTILESLSWDGSPGFPYVHGHFRSGPPELRQFTVDLHTPALRELSRLLHVREVWGVGSA